MKMQRKYLVLATVAGAIVAMDQAVKLHVHAHFGLGESVPVIKDIFHITYVRNTGAAFGFLRDTAESFRKIFFLAMPPVAMIVIASMLKSVDEDDRWQILSLSAIFGGALGNYVDRLRFGFVIDFLDFHYKEAWSYPAFNIADSAIVGGVCLLLLIMTVRDRAAKKAAPQAKA